MGTGTQVASIDPGNIPGGLFWTIPVAADSVDVNPGAGTATLQVRNVATRDFHDTVNDLKHGPSVPATASFAVQWQGVLERVKIRDTTHGFAGEFVNNRATMTWSASEAAFTFVSDAASTSHSEFAAVGHERNGQFFPQGG